MKQLNFFEEFLESLENIDKTPLCKNKSKNVNLPKPEAEGSLRCTPEGEDIWKLFIDGASRNNPGKAGAGVVIYKNGKNFLQHGFYLGIKTNNQAEYTALLLGVFILKKHICEKDMVMIFSDSQLMVRQVLGQYKVKSPELIPLFKLSKHLLSGINYNIAHVLRHENQEADEMANVGVDKGNKLPQDFLNMLRDYEIQL